MGRALSYAVRQKIIYRREKGQSFQQIAIDFGCSESGVKKIWYAYKKQGVSVLSNNYSNCGGKSTFPQSVKAAVKIVRDNNQGGNYVHSKLLKDYSDLPIPSSRTLTRWWKKEGTNRQRGRPRKTEKKTGLQLPTAPGK